MKQIIGLNLLWLIPGVVGGSEEYTVRLLDAVEPHLAPELEIELFCQGSLLEAHPGLADRFVTHLPPVATARKLARFGIESTWLPVASRHVDAMHHGGGVLPYDPLPQHRRRPSLVTIHDTQPLDLPSNFSRCPATLVCDDAASCSPFGRSAGMHEHVHQAADDSPFRRSRRPASRRESRLEQS